jgi:MIP family channel proteins
MQKTLAEAFGTFSLVFFGCGAIVVNELYGGLGHLGVCTVFGLIVMVMIYAIGNVSGAHINPAVTIGFYVARRINAKDSAIYILAQFAGALAAAALLRGILGNTAALGATIPSVGMWQTIAFEVVLTFVLMLVILNVSTGHKEKGIMAGVAVGGMVALAALVGGPLTGASMNPARSLAPAIVSGSLASWWIYLVAPVVGAILAKPVCRLIQGPGCCDEDC